MSISRPVRILVVSTVAALMLVGMIWSAVINGISGDAPLFGVAGLLMLSVASLLVLRVPENRVSWVMLLVALGFAMMVMTEVVGIDGWGGAIGGVGLFAFALPGMSVFVPLWFPTGYAPSPRWRWIAWLAVGGVALMFGGVALVEFVEQGDSDSIVGCVSVGTCSSSIGLTVLLIAVLSAIIAFIVRWVRSEGVERLQLRWLVPAFLIFGIGVGAEFGGLQGSFVANVFLAAGLALVPFSMGIAILRYRLYEIDRIINRTVVYGAVVAVLVGVYAAGVFLLRELLPVEGDLAVAASTLAVAALFNPLRKRVRRFVDRRFYRSRYQAEQVVEQFSTRLRDELDLGVLTQEWLAVVDQTVKPVSVGVWLRDHGGVVR